MVGRRPFNDRRDLFLVLGLRSVTLAEIGANSGMASGMTNELKMSQVQAKSLSSLEVLLATEYNHPSSCII